MMTLLYFTGSWCSACQKFKPVVQNVCSKYSDKVILELIDVELNPRLAEEYHVTALPKLVLLGDDGWAIKAHTEVMPVDELESWFN